MLTGCSFEVVYFFRFQDFFFFEFQKSFFMIKESLTLRTFSNFYFFDNLLVDWRLNFPVDNYCLSYLPRHYNSISIYSYCSTVFFAGCTTECTTASATFDAAANISIHSSSKQPAGRLTQMNWLEFLGRNSICPHIYTWVVFIFSLVVLFVFKNINVYLITFSKNMLILAHVLFFSSQIWRIPNKTMFGW